MQITPESISALAVRLHAERKHQGLTRQQAAAVCNVSPSFIRDAESNPGRCSLERLAHYTRGLGLSLAIAGWQADGEVEAGAQTLAAAP